MGISDWIARRAGYVKPPEPAAKKRAYTAAKINRLTSTWNTMPTPTDYDIRVGLRTLRARCREQSQNNDYIKRFLQLTRSNVVGPSGAVLRPRIVDTVGARTGQPDKLANEALSDAWRRWGAFGSPEVSGRFTWTGIQREFIANIARDGEVFVRRQHSGEHNEFQFALQFIDPELFDVDLNQDHLQNGNRINMAVELNEWNRPVAYYRTVATRGEQTTGLYSYGGRQYERIPAAEIYHRYLVEEGVSQTRGVPWFAASLYRLGMLNGYEEAELVAARVASAKMGFFEQEGGADEYTGEGEDADGNLVADAEPGTFEMLPRGVKVSEWSPNHPTTAFSEFVRANLRGAAAGLGVSYFTLANDLANVSYSSGRLGALEDRETWKSLQNWMIDCFCQPVFNDWLRAALTAGQVSVAGRPLQVTRLDKFSRVTWQARRWAWVDPQKDLTAQGIAIDRRIKSVSEIIREGGGDPDAVFEEIAAEKLKMQEMGITPADVVAALVPDEDPPPEEPVAA